MATLEQIPITHYFKIKNKNHNTSPKYFYYNNVCSFLETRPKDFNYIGTIKWRHYDTELVVGYSKNMISNNKKYLNKRNKKCIYNINHIPILKSNLQKCIRRGLTDSALKTALTMICIDKNAILRRLPIIMLEDAILDEDFLFLVWLMCAVSKGLELDDNLVEKILNIVNHLASSNIRGYYEKKEDNNDIRKFKLEELNNEEKNFLWAMELRRSYGGMKGDMKMINYLVDDWFTKFKNNYNLSKSEDVIKIKKIKLATKDDIHLSAIDFHCTNILGFLLKKYPNMDRDKLKKMMWCNRSSINVKKCIDNLDMNIEKYNYEVWLKIINYVNYASDVILGRLF